MASVNEDIERDTALYILSYLYNRGYSQTMSAFMTECSHLKILPDQNVMVLPSVPLEEIISEYKGRQSTSILVQSLGSQLAWKSLWEKLQETLTQINNLAQSLNWKKTPVASTTGRSRSKLVFSQSTNGPSVQRSSGNSVSSTLGPLTGGTPLIPSVDSRLSLEPTVGGFSAELPQPGPSIEPVIQPTVLLSSSANSDTPPIDSSGKSPRKRMQPSKRKQVEPKLSSGEELQQVVDVLLHSAELPNKLANLINQRVESEVREEEQTITAVTHSSLGNMFTSTTDSWLDEIIASTLGQQPSEHESNDSSNSSKRTRFDTN